MQKCDVQKCDVQKCDVQKCDVQKCDVQKCDVQKCDVQKCDVQKCDVAPWQHDSNPGCPSALHLRLMNARIDLHFLRVKQILGLKDWW